MEQYLSCEIVLQEQEEAENEKMADESEKALSKLRETFASELEDEKLKLKDEHKEALEELNEKLEKERDVVCENYLCQRCLARLL